MTSTVVSVEWSKPVTPNGIILGYGIGYKLQYGDDVMTNITLGSDSYFQNITGLGNYY